MNSMLLVIAVCVIIAILALVLVLARVVGGRAKRSGAAPSTATRATPGAENRTASTIEPDGDLLTHAGTTDLDQAAESATLDAPTEPTPSSAPESVSARLARLRDRWKKPGALGKNLLSLLSSGRNDEHTWDDIEEALLMADLGVEPTTELVDTLRARFNRKNSPATAEEAREIVAEELLRLVDPTMDRSLNLPTDQGRPAVVLVVGVNGAGKTTTIGKLARILVAEDKTVVLGAADTFRAAAADQLQTWGQRIGVETIRADKDGADPAAVAFDAVRTGIENKADVVVLDTAGRLQNKVGLMDELGKVKRVAEKALVVGDQAADQATIDEVLLVLDATVGQNGLRQAQVFSEVVNVTGVVLTKLDGSAKGGIVVAVQRQLGVPVKLVGLGEGPDDLAPFDPQGFVDALVN